jgi:hypothetical protein
MIFLIIKGPSRMAKEDPNGCFRFGKPDGASDFD